MTAASSHPSPYQGSMLPNDDHALPPENYLSRKRDIFVAFVVVSLPLLVISILLLLFVFASDREKPASYVKSLTLPFLEHHPQDAYYTKVHSGDFLLVGSWASTIAEFVVAPFMVLFSYAVAREVLNATRDHEDGSSRPPLLREIMRGAHVGSLVLDSDSNLTEGDPQNGSLVNAENGFTAFALSCEATIYDVRFSIINGSFYDFNTSISSPQKANIVQAPLQVGFGQYHLYQAASTAVLAINYSVALSMGKAFSQTGMALASGAFNITDNFEQRFRWTVNVTMVPKAPFFYLVAVCLVYSAFGIVMTVLALHLRRIPEVRYQQARLMVEWAPELLERDTGGEEDEKE